MKKIYLILGLIFLTLSCIGPKAEFILDNPTDETINVKIDGKDYKLDSRKYEKMILKPGEHSLILSDGKEVKFIVYVGSQGGVINPTRNDYVYVSMAYVRKGEGGVSPIEKTIILDGIEYEGPYEKINDLIIDKNEKKWSYNIYTPFPEVVETRDPKLKGKIETKLFTKKEFIDFVEFMSGTFGYHDENKKISDEKSEAEEKEIISYTVPDFKDKDTKKYAEELSELDKAYLNATDPKEQKKIQAASKKAWKNYVQSSMKTNDDMELKGKFRIHNIYKGVLIISE